MNLETNSQTGILVDKSNSDPTQYYGDNLKIFSDEYYRAVEAIEEYEKKRKEEKTISLRVSFLKFLRSMFSL